MNGMNAPLVLELTIITNLTNLNPILFFYHEFYFYQELERFVEDPLTAGK